MLPQRTMVALVMLLEACCTCAYAAYPESNGAQDFNPADGTAGLVADSQLPAGLQSPRNLDQALPALADEASQNQKAAHGNGDQSPLQEDVPERLVEDLRAVLWKMMAEGEIQSQEFTQTEQSPQQPSKRTCFWKYCITK